MNGNLQSVVEIPAGTNKKVEYDYISNTFPADTKDGEERVINAYPTLGIMASFRQLLWNDQGVVTVMH